MGKFYQNLKSAACGVGAITLVLGVPYYGLTNMVAKDTFRQGLQFKVEEVADYDGDGKLSVDEMVAVLGILEIEPSQKLRNGFYLHEDQLQRYLRATGNYDSEVDNKPSLGKKHPYFLKAEKEGKPIHHFRF